MLSSGNSVAQVIMEEIRRLLCTIKKWRPCCRRSRKDGSLGVGSVMLQTTFFFKKNTSSRPKVRSSAVHEYFCKPNCRMGKSNITEYHLPLKRLLLGRLHPPLPRLLSRK